jgi:hypothetical protein
MNDDLIEARLVKEYEMFQQSNEAVGWGLPDITRPYKPDNYGALSRQRKKSAFACEMNTKLAIQAAGPDRVVIGCLTFPYPVRHKFAAERMNAFLTAVRRMHYPYLWVKGQQHRAHFHFLLVVDFDVLTGTEKERLEARKSETKKAKMACCNPQLCQLWERLEDAARRAGFGRFDLAPLFTNGEKVGRYFRKQLDEAWPGVILKTLNKAQFWGCSRTLKRWTANFCWYTPGKPNRWKLVLEAFARKEGYGSILEGQYAYKAVELSFEREAFLWFMRIVTREKLRAELSKN